MFSGIVLASGQRCQEVDSLREPCAKHFSAYAVFFRTRHVIMISFFFYVRDIPLRFISLNVIFLGTFWSDLSDFCINILTGS